MTGSELNAFWEISMQLIINCIYTFLSIEVEESDTLVNTEMLGHTHSGQKEIAQSGRKVTKKTLQNQTRHS